MNGVNSKLERIQESLDNLELGKYAEFDIHQCCNYIGWVAKFKKVPKEVWEPLCEQAIRMLENDM